MAPLNVTPSALSLFANTGLSSLQSPASFSRNFLREHGLRHPDDMSDGSADDSSSVPSNDPSHGFQACGSGTLDSSPIVLPELLLLELLDLEPFEEEDKSLENLRLGRSWTNSPFTSVTGSL